MLSTDEIKKLTEYQVEVFKDVFVTKDDIKDINGKLNNLQTSVDNLSKDKKDKIDEIITINRRLKETENWIDKAAPKLDIKFDH